MLLTCKTPIVHPPQKTKAVLLDIDGTLLHAQEAVQQAFSLALKEVLGLEATYATQLIASIDMRGLTDKLVCEQLSRALENSQHQTALEALTTTILQAYFVYLEQCLTSKAAKVLPGVYELLEHLESYEHVCVGLLTGNMKESATAKLASAKLAYLVERPGGFGDDAKKRVDIALIAKQRLTTLYGELQPNALVVIGDTEHDIHCARHIQATAVAVGTGWTPISTLQAAKPDLYLADFTTATALYALLEP